jgi:hypothetical protein
VVFSGIFINVRLVPRMIWWSRRLNPIPEHIDIII